MLLSRENYTLFTPMLPEVTSGELEVRHVVTPDPRRSCGARGSFWPTSTKSTLHAATVRYHHVLTGIGTTLHYDHIVLALGSSTVDVRSARVAEHFWALKSLEDADALRNHLVWLLELADTIEDESTAQTAAHDRRRRRRVYRRRSGR